MLKTTITGSLPRPAWLAEPGKHEYRAWSIPSEYLCEAHDDAVRLAIADQEEAGLDIVTDGEQRRRHYIDVGTDEIETPTLVASRIRNALLHVHPEHLYPCTDCGMAPRPRAVARGKMRALVEGAAIVRKEL